MTKRAANKDASLPFEEAVRKTGTFPIPVEAGAPSPAGAGAETDLRHLEPTNRTANLRVPVLGPPPPRAASKPAPPERPYRAPRAFRVERDGMAPLTVAIYPDRTYAFGRAPSSDFVFPSDAVSRQHGQLHFNHEGRWVYRDLNSRNGSFVAATPRPSARDWRVGARELKGGGEVSMEAGTTLLLANGASRIVFLEEAPAELPAAPRGGFRTTASRQLEREIALCARHRHPVFLLGPSGSGKTFAARQIHELARMEGQFVVVNCSRLPHDPAQLTSELLGHLRGAFTGAVSDRMGKLFCADGGTLFLDEVESLPEIAQGFLLDVLEGSGDFSPYGAAPNRQRVAPRVRLISASKAPLAASGLRPDLCQRLSAGEIILLPTLEERRADIPSLIEGFLAKLASEKKVVAELTPDALRFLQQADWPGQIRELEATVSTVVSREQAEREYAGARPARLVVGLEAVQAFLDRRRMGFGRPLAAAPAPAAPEGSLAPRKRPADLNREDVEGALARCGGNKTRAADSLGIALNTLKAKMRAFGIGG